MLIYLAVLTGLPLYQQDVALVVGEVTISWMGTIHHVPTFVDGIGTVPIKAKQIIGAPLVLMGIVHCKYVDDLQPTISPTEVLLSRFSSKFVGIGSAFWCKVWMGVGFRWMDWRELVCRM